MCGRSYQITPATISITGNGRLSVGKDLEAVLRKIEHRHQAPIITFSIMARHGRGAWHGVPWDGETATSFPLNLKTRMDGAENRVVLLRRKHLRISGFSPGRLIAERWD